MKVTPNIPMLLPRIVELSSVPKEIVEELIKEILEEKPELGEYKPYEQVFIKKEKTDGIIQDLIKKPISTIRIYSCNSC